MIRATTILLILLMPGPVERCSGKDGAIDLHILAGQSNAQGFQGDADQYPADVRKVDARIPFYYRIHGEPDGGGKWETLGPQKGRFPKGHFGLEVTFARALLAAGERPAIFKYTLGSTSLAMNWKGPGEKGMYDDMCRELLVAIQRLRERGDEVKVRSFIWIQGESDAETDDMAAHYQERLGILVEHIRKVLGDPLLPIILGADEKHPWVAKRPVVIQAQKNVAAANRAVTFSTMNGLEKADTSHLTPVGLVSHGLRIFDAYRALKASGDHSGAR